MKGVLVALAALLAVGSSAGAGVETPLRVDASSPGWTDAHRIAFTYEAWGAETGTYRSYGVGDDGSGFQATTEPQPDPTVSPDGRHRFVLDVASDTLVVDGGRVAKDVFPGASHVAWSPDSTRIAFVSDGGVDVLRLGGASFRHIHSGDGVAWISNSELAVGNSRFGDAGQVFAVRADGTHAYVLATAYSAIGGLAVSPDGSEIAFAVYLGWGYDRGTTLYVSSTSGIDRDVHRVTPTICTIGEGLSSLGGRCIDGTDGPDTIVGTKRGDIVVAGPGDDVVHAGDGQNTVYGQWGNDTILTGSYVDTVDGGAGNDVIRTGAGEDWINGGPGRDIVDAGRGPDHVVANDGERDVIDCGPGNDEVRADKFDVLSGCEHITIAPPYAIP